MIHLHVTKEVFEKIKNGTKKTEYRPFNKYYYIRFGLTDMDIIKNDKIKIYLGYPKKTDKEKIIYANCRIYITVMYTHLIDPLFIKYYPEYKGDEKVCVYRIELENLK